MAAKDFIVAIELGSSSITGIAGKKNNDGSIQIFAYAKEEASSFIRKGVVYNIDKMAQGLTSVVHRLESELNVSIAKVYVGVGGQSLRSKKNFEVRQMEEETKIQKELVDSMMNSNRHTSYPGMEILEVVPQEYKVKNSSITDPIGMISNQIEGHFLNIVANLSVKQNLYASFQQANVEIAGFLIAPIALGDIVLTDAEKRSGCTLVDFGADITTVAVYKNNLLRHLVVLPLGGHNITKDICNLQIEEADAEMLKVKYGYAYTDPEDKEAEERYYSLEGKGSIAAKTLNEIVEARTEELIANILNQVEQSGYKGRLAAGFVLTGGGANLKRLTEAFTRRHKENKVRIAGSVQGDIKATLPELLTKDGKLNTLFGLLAAGKENCCKIEIQPIPEDLFGYSREEEEKDEEQKQKEQERTEKEKEAERMAQDDECWRTCRDEEAWGEYLEQYPHGRHAQEAAEAIRAAEQKRLDKADDDFWEKCRAERKWRQYKKKYPEGRHIEEARKEIDKEPSWRTKLASLGKTLLEEE